MWCDEATGQCYQPGLAPGGFRSGQMPELDPFVSCTAPAACAASCVGAKHLRGQDGEPSLSGF